MQSVILIGDSIRLGYQEIVRRKLGPGMDVWGPDENGQDSRYVLDNLDRWLAAEPPGIVHINCGLWDLKRAFDSPATVVPLDEYAANVRAILGRAAADHTVIWATTTPVNQQQHHAMKEFDRFEADVVAYNDVAKGVARELGIRVNDLWAAAMVDGLLLSDLAIGDGVHFSSGGYERLARLVCAAITGLE